MRRESIAVLLGLLGCTPRASSSPAPAPAPASALDGDAEPTARAEHVAAPPSTSEPSEIPASREWCGATIDTRPRPLLRTESCLLAWTELRRASLPIPSTQPSLDEPGACTTLCGSPTCTITEPRALEFSEGNHFGIGTVVDTGGGSLLAIPELSPFFTPSRCFGVTTIHAEPVGELLHLWAIAEPRPTYHFHGYSEYGGCYAPHGRHDVIVDPRTDTLVLDIEHREAILRLVASEAGALQVSLSGCNQTLELTWTRASPSL